MRNIPGKALIIAAAALVPTFAAAQSAPAETRVPEMGRFIEWRADGEQGVFIRAYNGRWYYARTESPCARLDSTQRLNFQTAPNGDLDRFGAVVAEGWRCQLSSVVESGPPPSRDR